MLYVFCDSSLCFAATDKTLIVRQTRYLHRHRLARRARSESHYRSFTIFADSLCRAKTSTGTLTPETTRPTVSSNRIQIALFADLSRSLGTQGLPEPNRQDLGTPRCALQGQHLGRRLQPLERAYRRGTHSSNRLLREDRKGHPSCRPGPHLVLGRQHFRC